YRRRPPVVRTLEYVETLVGSLVLVLLLAGTGFGIRALLRNFPQTKFEWDAAARHLGLAVTPRLLSVPDISGMLGHVEVLVTYQGSSFGDQTSFTGIYPSLGMGLKVSADNSFKRSIRRLKRTDDANPSEGGNLRVRGTDEAIVKDFMIPRRMAAAGVAIEQYPGMEITDTRISFDIHGRVKTAAELVNHITVLTQTAEVLLSPAGQRSTVGDASMHTSEPSSSPIHSGGHSDPTITKKAPSRSATPARRPVQVESPPAPLSDGSVNAQAVAEELFLGTRVSFVVEEAFDTEYAGQRIRWQGPVISMRPYTSDHHFGETPGVKIVVMIAEVVHDLYGRTKIDIVAALPAGTPLIDRGDPVTITGTLDELDVPKRSIYLK
ncbi:hypothetical protein MNBD_ACTINO02-2606, partial [hydrothermal vent metagenome]